MEARPPPEGTQSQWLKTLTDYFFSTGERRNGGQVPKFGERLGELSDTVILFETEAYPEPKVLSYAELCTLRSALGINRCVAQYIGGSSGFVRDTLASDPFDKSR